MANATVEKTTLRTTGLSKKVIWKASEGLTVAMGNDHVKWQDVVTNLSEEKGRIHYIQVSESKDLVYNAF